MKQDGSTMTLPYQTVVLAFGYKPYNPLENIAKKYCKNVDVIAGATKTSNALIAIEEGYKLGLSI